MRSKTGTDGSGTIVREIHAEEIRDTVAQMCIAAACQAGRDERQPATERPGQGAAEESGDQICRSAGIAVFFVEIGQDLRVKNGFVAEAINEGVRKASREKNLPKAIVDPLTRKHTDSSPSIMYTELVPGDRLRISFMQGEGVANGGEIRMLDPSAGVEGIKRFVCECAGKVLGDSRSPAVIGVGIGGNFEKAALLARKALLRPAGSPNAKLELSSLEELFVKAANKAAAGPEGPGGRTTVSAVHVESYPCHSASLPVAVIVNCRGEKPATVLF